ncbi:hypothetical protein [Sulfoacidibacillus thermotolerans]|uniref:Uncharacterized protein n=1 Tax=Sulfoacidibacillus thermotolerans TaxID=1765684 RepID=A0A2U3DCF3_SULT2|nr:hypothetical protein [Sulfoacidibacillus thermotolerans]PWI58967.1 hypothetical protein BM613_02530 [Sulfoacidibacillus thermotolerans]
MHVKAKMHATLDEERAVIDAPGAKLWLENYLCKEDRAPLSLRFAASPFENAPHLVIGLREQGRGIDLLVPVAQCATLLQAPVGILVRTGETRSDLQVDVDFDEDAFSTFIEHAATMYQEFPDHEVWGALSMLFSDGV